MDEFLILLQAKLDEAKSKGNVNSDIEKLQGQLDKLKIQAEIDSKTITNLVKQLETVLNQKIVISDIGINSNTAVKAAQHTGQQIDNAINQGVSSAVSKANKTLKSFAELKIGTGNIDAILDKDGLLDAEKSLNKIKAIYSEFGQVKITNKIFDPEGNLQQFRVDIQQVNGELKESRNFMMALSSDGKSFSFPQDVIKGSESFVHHLNEAKNISNATGEELNVQKEKLAEQEKYYAKLEQASKEQLAIEKQRITAGEKQLEILDAQSKRRDSRISYNEGQINKKGLTNISKQREINDLAYSEKEKVDTSFAKEIDKSLSSLSKLKQKWQEQGIYVDEFRMKVETLEKSLDEISIGDVKGLNNLKQQLNSLSTEAESLNRLNEIQLSIGDKGGTTAQIKVLRDNFTKLGLSANEVSSKMNGVDKEIIELKSLMNSGANGSAIIAQFDKLQTSLKETQNDLKTTRSEYSLLVSAQQRLNKANAIEEWKQKNSAATKQAQADTQAYIDSLRNLNVQMTKMEFDQISRGFKETENSMRGLGKLGASLKDQISQAAQSFTQWLSVSSVVMALVYQLQKVPKEVIAVNSAMVELRKVSNASDSDITKYFDEAAESAKKYGSSVSDLISATADWSRLGYNLPDSKKLAEVATLYKNVGDGIDIATANESLVSTLQGFKLNADDAMHIIDAFNEVGNNFAIGSDGIGEALKRSASSMYAAGNTLEETIGLVTAAKIYWLKDMETYFYRTYLNALIA